MKREDWQKVYEPKGDMLDIRVRHTLRLLDDGAKRRLSMKKVLALALVATLALASAVALAAGLVFSDDYDAVRLANRALEEEYGITDEMQTYFARQVTEENGVTTVTYAGLEDMRHVLGVYTVVVGPDGATAAWSCDGISTQGGLDAYAWGAEQIGILIEIAKDEQGFSQGYHKAQEILADMEEQQTAVSIAKGDDPTAVTQMDGSVDMAGISVSEEEAIVIAKQAFAEEYGLTQAQLDQMQYEKDYAGYTYAVVDGTTICEVWFWLHQQESEYHTDGDGLYWARINAQTGEVKDMSYDSALAGNG